VHAGIEVTRVSPVYETEAMDDAAGQRDFYNAVAEVESELQPRELLAACKDIEQQLGREPSERRHAPRTIDIDLLLFGDQTIDEPDLVIPHPGIAHRAFVQVPLQALGVELPGPVPEGQRVTMVDPTKDE
jgi:2-amino-4-hydroxy-6-hydroxymethyldihydropteridine diphosphokinase